jgi:hypothetical protein
MQANAQSADSGGRGSSRRAQASALRRRSEERTESGQRCRWSCSRCPNHRGSLAARVRASAGCGQCRCSNRGGAVVILVLRNVVDGHIEAGSVGDVENVKAELQVHPLSDLGVLHERNVHAPLPGLAKNIALSGGEVGFVGIVERKWHRPRRRASAAEW